MRQTCEWHIWSQDHRKFEVNDLANSYLMKSKKILFPHSDTTYPSPGRTLQCTSSCSESLAQKKDQFMVGG